jgi:PiT family inorganic phosphate transporter
VAFFVIMGALLQGHKVMKTIGKGIVTEELPPLAIIVAMLSAGLFVTLATFFKIPVSTSQAIVGGVGGVGFAVGAEVDLSKMLTIVQAWVISPFLTATLAFFLYHLFAIPLRRIRRVAIWDRIFGVLVISSASYVAFSLGANNVGNAVGPIANIGEPSIWLILMGGAALAIGSLTYGRGVTETVGGGITPLDPMSAFAAQASAALAIHFFSILGIPVSTSQAIVGAVVGVGLVKGARAISKKRIIEIVIGWAATPTIAGLSSWGLYKLVLFLS